MDQAHYQQKLLLSCYKWIHQISLAQIAALHARVTANRVSMVHVSC